MIGALIGDTVGSVYEFNNVRSKEFELFCDYSFLTDDSMMTLAVAEILQKKYIYNKDKIIDTLKKWGRTYEDRGYGGRFLRWLLSDSRQSYRSYGNGAAMRISPVGWYAKNEDEVKDFSRRITEVTHSHPEGLKGAEVTAMCIYYARIGKSKEFIKEYVKQYYDIDFDYENLKKHYYFNETCQESVPQAIYCFLISNSFEDCLRTTISIGGDCDTTAAISCAIAEAYYKNIDENLVKETLRRLPKSKNGCNALDIICSFNAYSIYDLVQCEEIKDDTMFVCIEEVINGKYQQEWIHATTSKNLSSYMTWMLLDNYFEVEDDQFSKDFLYEKKYKECAEVIEHCILYKNNFATMVSNSFYKNTASSDFESLKKHCKELNEILMCANLQVKFKCFNDKKEALVYKNIDTMSDKEILELFNEKR